MHVRIFPPPCIYSLILSPIFLVFDLVFTFCPLPVWHVVGASGEDMMASHVTPSLQSHRRLHVQSPSSLLTSLETFIASLSSLYLIQIQNFIFFPSSSIQPASEQR